MHKNVRARRAVAAISQTAKEAKMPSVPKNLPSRYAEAMDRTR